MNKESNENNDLDNDMVLSIFENIDDENEDFYKPMRHRHSKRGVSK